MTVKAINARRLESYSDEPEPIDRWLAQEFGKELGSMLFALDVIEAHDPIAGLAFHGCVVRALAERLERQNELLAADDRG